jgi:hypothetical protein
MRAGMGRMRWPPLGDDVERTLPACVEPEQPGGADREGQEDRRPREQAELKGVDDDTAGE